MSQPGAITTIQIADGTHPQSRGQSADAPISTAPRVNSPAMASEVLRALPRMDETKCNSLVAPRTSCDPSGSQPFTRPVSRFKPHSPEVVAKVMRLRASNVSASRIADMMGFTKNQVIGIWNRNRLDSDIKRSPNKARLIDRKRLAIWLDGGGSVREWSKYTGQLPQTVCLVARSLGYRFVGLRNCGRWVRRNAV